MAYVSIVQRRFVTRAPGSWVKDSECEKKDASDKVIEAFVTNCLDTYVMYTEACNRQFSF